MRRDITKLEAEKILREIEKRIGYGEEVLIITKFPGGKSERCNIDTGIKELNNSYNIVYYSHDIFGSFDCSKLKVNEIVNILFPIIDSNK